MFLSGNKTSKISVAKARLNTHTHKLDSIETTARKPRSPDSSQSHNPPGPPSPSEVLVFNNSHHSSSSSGGGGGSNAGNRSSQMNRSLPKIEVPQIDEINQYFKDTWEMKMREINSNKLTVLHLGNESNTTNTGPSSRNGPTTSSSRNNSHPKHKNSPQHHGSRKM